MVSLLLQAAAWPFICAGFLLGFIGGSFWQGIGGGLACIEDLINHILEGSHGSQKKVKR